MISHMYQCEREEWEEGVRRTLGNGCRSIPVIFLRTSTLNGSNLENDAYALIAALSLAMFEDLKCDF